MEANVYMEIGTVVITVVFLLAVAHRKSSRRRKFRRYIKGQVDEEMAIGTLAPKDVISTGFDQSVVERTFISSMKAAWSLTNVTASSTAGPLLVGIAHGDYTSAEIEEWIENTGSWSEADQVGQEMSRRKIRRVGIFRDQLINEQGIMTLQEGRLITTKLGWILTTGQSLQSWAYNLGTGAYATTDPSVDIQGHVNLWPR